MGGTTHNMRRLATVTAVAGALTILVPVAQADTGFRGSPDAIDRALAAQAEKIAAIDAREPGMLERPALTDVGAPGPDAFERALITHADAMSSLAISTLDAGERVLGSPPSASSPIVTGNGFDWGDFGIGAGAGIGLMLLILGLGAGVPAARHGHSAVTNP